jgi:hypothetical protein
MGQSRMDTPETLATSGTQDTERKYMLEKTECAIKNGHSWDIDNIAYRRLVSLVCHDHDGSLDTQDTGRRQSKS